MSIADPLVSTVATSAARAASIVISPEEAWDRIADELEPLPVVERRRETVHELVLAADLEARVDVPGVDVSAMDGYAFAAPVVADQPYPVVTTIAAGDAPGYRLEVGNAVRIMTGAPVPTGADRVVPIEGTDGGEKQVRVAQEVAAGSHIRRRGEVLRVGQPLLPRGSLVTAGARALLATHGFVDLPVFRPPTVAIITTGDEVVAPESTPGPGQLRDSHTDFLTSAVAAAGAEPYSLGIAPDDREVLRERVAAGLEADVLLLCGGVSMGEFDLVEGVLEQAGCRFLFDTVAIQPGKPLVVAAHENGLVFGLPGNPASAMVCFWLYVRPALRQLMGIEDGYWRTALDAEAETALPAARGRDLFLPARVRFQGGTIKVAVSVPKGSHDLAAYARGTALVRIPALSPSVAAGSHCEILPLGSWIGDG